MRTSGVLLHITSLPSPYGVGTLGKEAYHFVDWLVSSGIHLWQVLPLVPTNYGDSPYQSVSSTALNYYLIDLDALKKQGLLKEEEYKGVLINDELHTNYSMLFDKKIPLLKLAFSRFDSKDASFLKFVKKGEYHDFAMFMVLKSMHQYKPWFLWEKSYQKYSLELEKEIVANPEYLFWQWTQYEFFKEWTALHAYANLNKVKIMGDMPLYVAYDSVEVWKYPELFLLTEDKKLKLVAGCPPDAFSEDGQLWGNPIYDWEYMRGTHYAWWNNRIKRSFKLYDYLRIDHFRGFDRYYAIPAKDDTAKNGSWLDGPKFELFENKTKMPIIAEDLGMIDEGVRELLKKTGYPGMKVLAFAFDGNSHNDYLPSNYEKNCVVYTGTHDNMPLCQQLMDLDNTGLEILLKELKEECKYLNVPFNAKNFKAITTTLVELAFASNAKIAIVPMQDLLAQEGASRMNFPSSVSNQNWSYRIRKQDLSKALAKRILSYNQKYHR